MQKLMIRDLAIVPRMKFREVLMKSSLTTLYREELAIGHFVYQISKVNSYTKTCIRKVSCFILVFNCIYTQRVEREEQKYGLKSLLPPKQLVVRKGEDTSVKVKNVKGGWSRRNTTDEEVSKK